MLVSRLEAGAVAGAQTWVSESSAPHGAEQAFEDGWFAGVRAVSSYLLRIADDAAAQQGRAASSAELRAHLRQSAPPGPPPAAPPAAPAPDPGEVLANRRYGHRAATVASDRIARSAVHGRMMCPFVRP